MMSSVVLALTYSAASLGLGAAALRALLGRSAAAALPTLATEFLLGQALLGAALTMLALLSWFNRPVVAALVLLCAAGLPFAASQLKECFHSARSEVGAQLREPASLQIVACASIVLALAFAVAALVRPPIGDAEAFYFAYPKIIAAAEHLAPMPGLYANFSTIGLAGELHFAALMLLGNAAAAKLFVWPVAIAGAVMLLAIGARCGLRRKGQLFLLAMLMTSSTFTHYIWDGKVDLFAAAMGLSAVYWILEPSRQIPNAAPIKLAGLMAGFAAVAKFSYIVAFLPPAMVLIAWRTLAEMRDKNSGRAMVAMVAARLVAFGIWAALAWAPQLLKNAALFGAPLAPFIGGPQEKNWLQQIWFAEDMTRRILLTYPIALVFGRYPMQGGNLSFLALALLPLALLLPRPRVPQASLLVQVTIIALLGLGLWMLLRPSIIAPRYLLATVLLTFPLIALAAEHAWEMEQKPRLLRAAIIVCILAAVAAASYHVVSPLRILITEFTGDGNRCALASAYCAPFLQLNTRAEPGDRAFLAGYYGYWLRADLLQCRDISEDNLALRENYPILEKLHRRGFRFVIADKTTHPKAAEAMRRAVAPPWLAVHRSLETPELVIWELTPLKGSPRREAACVQSNPPRWSVTTFDGKP